MRTLRRNASRDVPFVVAADTDATTNNQSPHNPYPMRSPQPTRTILKSSSGKFPSSPRVPAALMPSSSSRITNNESPSSNGSITTNGSSHVDDLSEHNSKTSNFGFRNCHSCIQRFSSIYQVKFFLAKLVFALVLFLGCVLLASQQFDNFRGMTAPTDTSQSSKTVAMSLSEKSLLLRQKLARNKTKANFHVDDDYDFFTNETVVLVYISERIEALIPSIGSIIRNSHPNLTVEVVIIGNTTVNEQVRSHFGTRISKVHSLTIDDVTEDLQSQMILPVWTWSAWHESIDDEDDYEEAEEHDATAIVTKKKKQRTKKWQNKYTIHPAEWDNSKKHAQADNHVRFYLPYLSVLSQVNEFYFLSDSVLVQNDISRLLRHRRTKVTVDDIQQNNSNTGLIAACNAWIWNDQCQHFTFQVQQDFILSMPALYGKQKTCEHSHEMNCVPTSYRKFIQSMLSTLSASPSKTTDADEVDDEDEEQLEKIKQMQNQHGWNFGFTLYDVENWKRLNLTQRYEFVMKENYQMHIFPETSLGFGLGIAYLAFAGSVQCWENNNKNKKNKYHEAHWKVRDGFGFIEWERMKSTFGDSSTTGNEGFDNFENDTKIDMAVMESMDVLHYSGLQKPWESYSPLHPTVLKPWLDMMEMEELSLPSQLPTEPTRNLFLVMGGTRTGTHWLMSLLDSSNNNVCATGEYKNGEAGYPSDALYPGSMDWYPPCTVKRGCSLSFVRDTIQNELSKNTYRCNSDYDTKFDPLTVDHLRRLCHFMKVLDGNYSSDTITKQWVTAFVNEDTHFMGCSCTRGVKAKGLKLIPDWIHYKNYPLNSTGPADLNLNNTALDNQKIIRIKRTNLWSRYKSFQIAKATDLWHVATLNEKKLQLQRLKENPITIDVNDLKWSIQYMITSDQAGDEWAKEHGSDVLWIEYEKCKHSQTQCFQDIYQFIGVARNDADNDATGNDNTILDSATLFDTSLDHITNAEEVRQALIDNDWGHYIDQILDQQ